MVVERNSSVTKCANQVRRLEHSLRATEREDRGTLFPQFMQQLDLSQIKPTTENSVCSPSESRDPYSSASTQSKAIRSDAMESYREVEPGSEPAG